MRQMNVEVAGEATLRHADPDASYGRRRQRRRPHSTAVRRPQRAAEPLMGHFWMTNSHLGPSSNRLILFQEQTETK